MTRALATDVGQGTSLLEGSSPGSARWNHDSIAELGAKALPSLPYLKDRLADKELRKRAKEDRDDGLRRCIRKVVRKMAKYRAF